MTKEEKIKEVWNYFGGEVDENGWRLIQSKFINEVKNIEISDCGKYYRPLSLQGIENNNGWIKIESEDDLPKENGMYHVHYADGVISSRYYHLEKNDWLKEPKATHYQPIVKPKSPIY